MQHMIVLFYTTNDDEHIKGILLYDDMKLSHAFLHTTFVDAYWTTLVAKSFMCSGRTPNTAEIIKDAGLLEVTLAEIPSEHHNFGEIELRGFDE